MRSSSKGSWRAAPVPFCAVLLVAAAVQASPDTLRMASGNLLQAPLDVALSPVTSGIAIARNLPEVSDRLAGRVAYGVFAAPGLLVMQVLSGAGRALSGALQVAPGLALFPLDADLGEEFDPFARGQALFEARNPLADEPPWLVYVLPLTPFTADAKLGITSPWVEYAAHVEEHRGP